MLRLASLLSANASLLSGAPRIVGGVTNVGKDPYFASLSITATSGGTYRCGGYLAAPTAVVTAAHCLQLDDGLAAGVTVTVGGGTLAASSTQVRVVSRAGMFPHPNYDPNTVTYDVAVLRLPTPITSAIAPLPTILTADVDANSPVRAPTSTPMCQYKKTQ